MRVGKAQRRWIKWCRYVQKTQSRANAGNRWGTTLHDGQAKAYADVMYAHRWAPNGVREPWWPGWGEAR